MTQDWTFCITDWHKVWKFLHHRVTQGLKRFVMSILCQSVKQEILYHWVTQTSCFTDWHKVWNFVSLSEARFESFCVLFSTKPERSAKHFLAAEFYYCWLYPGKQAIDYFMLFTCFDHVLFSHLERSVKDVLTVALSACAVRLFIARSMNNITGPTNTRTEPGYKLNCTWQVRWAGYRLNNRNTDIHLCSNYPTLLTEHSLTTMICWLC